MDDEAQGLSSSWSGPRSQPQTITRDNGTVTVRGFEPQTETSRYPIGPHRASVGPTGVPIPDIRQRRQSLAQRIGSLGDAGGANSFNRFAASWQRAAGFPQITPTSRSHSSHAATESEQVESLDGVPDLEQGPPVRASLLRAALENDRRESPFPDDESLPEGHAVPSLRAHQDSQPASSSHGGEIPEIATSYGSSGRTSRMHDSISGATGRRASLPPGAEGTATDKERQPLLRKRIESQDGDGFEDTLGESTLPQTIFNSVNVLVGVGMLSLPLGIRYGGWLIGMVFFFFSAVGTSYTAKLLAKCLDVDRSLVTFADIAYTAFGHRVQIMVSLLFSLELLAACVALVILFADSMELLVTALSLDMWKAVCGIILVPLSFLPLRFLSFTSIVGIVCCVAITGAVIIDGIIKPEAVGSLRDPAITYVFPKDWRTLPLSFGLLMAPWGGHSVFPNIYRDMRHPKKYNRAVNITYAFTYLLEACLAVTGYLMFGEGVKDEITKNIFLTEGYPRWLSLLIMIAITIVPITKVPLTARPIISTIEIFFGVEERATTGALANAPRFQQNLTRFLIRIGTPVVLVVVAILIPSFDRVMSLLGSLACFSICFILPCSFHLKIFGKDLSLKRRILDWTILLVCLVMAIVGTVCSFLPKEMLGATG